MYSCYLEKYMVRNVIKKTACGASPSVVTLTLAPFIFFLTFACDLHQSLREVGLWWLYFVIILIFLQVDIQKLLKQNEFLEQSIVVSYCLSVKTLPSFLTTRPVHAAFHQQKDTQSRPNCTLTLNVGPYYIILNALYS